MWRTFPSVSNCAALLPTVAHFFRCSAFFRLCRIFANVAHFPWVAHFSKCAALFQWWSISANVCGAFSMCGALFYVWCTFQCAAFFAMRRILFSVCRTFLSVMHFLVCAILIGVTPFSIYFPSVPHFLQCAALFQVWCIFPNAPNFANVAHFSKYGAVYQVWPVFVTMALLSKCAAFFQILAHFCKSAELFTVRRIFHV